MNPGIGLSTGSTLVSTVGVAVGVADCVASSVSLLRGSASFDAEQPDTKIAAEITPATCTRRIVSPLVAYINDTPCHSGCQKHTCKLRIYNVDVSITNLYRTSEFITRSYASSISSALISSISAPMPC